MELTIPKSSLERIVILGGGFAGIELAKNLSSKKIVTDYNKMRLKVVMDY